MRMVFVSAISWLHGPSSSFQRNATTPGPAIRRVALVLVVGETGSPEMEAPEGTSAPTSSPFGPVPMQGEPASKARLLRMFCAVMGPAALTNIGSAEMLPAPGQLFP